ncbi:MAG TPA: L,D-transpeptidase family protein [Gaiellaceae bacterium]|jgi:L,D-peptidoglycan transpeptidase YkuD (ErfK/YbiS/YcfS/YnhG family)
MVGALARASPARPGCPASLASELASTRTASQVVTVVASRSSSTTGTMQLWERRNGCWHTAAGPWSAYLGFAGVSGDHREGDGTTPTGAFTIGSTMYGVSPDPGLRYRYHRLVCGDWWDEDSSSTGYNSLQHVPCGTRPAFKGSSEPLWQSTHAYAHFALIDYNIGPAVPGRGSAIFIHADLGHATNGCISLSPSRLVTLLRWLDPSHEPLIVIGTAARIRDL